VATRINIGSPIFNTRHERLRLETMLRHLGSNADPPLALDWINSSICGLPTCSVLRPIPSAGRKGVAPRAAHAGASCLVFLHVKSECRRPPIAEHNAFRIPQ
jgi:hypothetical protein